MPINLMVGTHISISEPIITVVWIEDQVCFSLGQLVLTVKESVLNLLIDGVLDLIPGFLEVVQISQVVGPSPSFKPGIPFHPGLLTLSTVV